MPMPDENWLKHKKTSVFVDKGQSRHWKVYTTNEILSAQGFPLMILSKRERWPHFLIFTLFNMNIALYMLNL